MRFACLNRRQAEDQRLIRSSSHCESLGGETMPVYQGHLDGLSTVSTY